MQAAIDQFRTNMGRVRSLEALYRALLSQVTSAIDLSDILRAALVMVVSSLDHYVHELVRLGMTETWKGRRSATAAFHRFSISLGSARYASAGNLSDDWLNYEVSSRHRWRSFQHPDKVSEALRLISDASLWDEVSVKMGLPSRDIRQQLELIVDRRNKIAHEADLNPAFPNARWPIDERLVDVAATFVERLAEAIFEVV